MKKTISFIGALTLQDVLYIDHYYYRYLIRWPIRLLVALVLLPIAILAFFEGLKTGFTLLIILIILFCIYFSFGWLLHRKIFIRKYYKKKSAKYIDNTIIFTEDDIKISSINMESRFNWSLVFLIISTSHGLLFLAPQNNVIFWLPQRVFEDNQYKDEILEFAKKHSIPIKRIK